MAKNIPGGLKAMRSVTDGEFHGAMKNTSNVFSFLMIICHVRLQIQSRYTDKLSLHNL